MTHAGGSIMSGVDAWIAMSLRCLLRISPMSVRIAESNWKQKNFVADFDALFDTICFGCTDINRPLIDDMAGSGE